VYTGDEIGRYGFGDDHPLGENRIYAFWDEMHRRNLAFQVRICDPVIASEAQLKLFHTPEYVEKVKDYGFNPKIVAIADIDGAVIDLRGLSPER
jgi:acetoin utilization protein AcuC